MAENGQEPIDQQMEDQLLADDESEQDKLTDVDATENGHTEDYQKLIDHGIDKKVADTLDRIYKTGKLSHSDLDDRAMDALKEFPAEDAVAVLKQFCDSSLEHVANKSAYLCGQMKMYRQRTKTQGSSNNSAAKGPDEEKLKEILDRTGYSLDVTTGQRKYGGPPPGYDSSPPGAGHEVFCGKIPKDIFEDELIPLFEKCGKIWDLRLMVDSMTGFNRGYCFVTYCDKEGATEAVKILDNHEIRKGKRLKVNISIANVRLYIGSIPKSKSKEDIKEEFSKYTEGLLDVIVYGSADNPKWKNRGFAFLEYDSHKSASAAKKKLLSGRIKAWGNEFVVDWADPLEEPDSQTMMKVKVLYVRNLTSDVTEELLKEKFGSFGKLERAKKIKDYGFIHFEERDDAIRAMESLNQQKIGGMEIEVSLAKPPTENKKKEQRKRDQDRRTPTSGRYPGYDEYWNMPPNRMLPPPPQGRGMRRPPPPPLPPGRGGYDPYYDEYYPYDDYDYFGGYAPPPPRGRGRGAPGPPPPRGRGAISPRGATRGTAVQQRGAMRGGTRGGGARGGGPPARGGRGGIQQQKSLRAGKRKAGTDFSQGQSKRRIVQDNWGAQPIAQQPLDQSSYGGGYTGNDAQWYQDTYGGNW